MSDSSSCFDVAIVGGGASGLMASIAAARAGRTVTLLERLNRVGKKLLVTGNGRCNLCHASPTPQSLNGDPDFIHQVLEQLSVPDTLKLFEDMGLALTIEPDGKVFPRTQQASTVLDILRSEAQHLGVVERVNFDVRDIQRDKNDFEVVSQDGTLCLSHSLVLCAGGKAHPDLGSNGSGHGLAEKLGHTLTPLFPSLVQIKLDAPFLKSLQGIRMQARMSLVLDQQEAGSEIGEILWTEYGVSGIPVLNLSRNVNCQSHISSNKYLNIDMFPDRNQVHLESFLAQRFESMAWKTLDQGLTGLIHKRVIQVILKTSGLNPTQTCSEIGSPEISRISMNLKGLKIRVIGTQSWNDAQVTSGGVNTQEIRSTSLESKKVPGLFFAGEILDVDGLCGGHNLQWAWSSGWVAGTHAGTRATGQFS